MSTDWHVPDEELLRYAGRASTPPWLWSTETHLAACAHCRKRLAGVVGPGVVSTGWSRLDAERRRQGVRQAVHGDPGGGTPAVHEAIRACAPTA